MPALKYKSGNTWLELNNSGGGISLDDYPINSIYIAPAAAFGIYSTSAPSSTAIAVPNLATIESPAAKIGGNWERLFATPAAAGNINIDGISLNIGQFSGWYQYVTATVDNNLVTPTNYLTRIGYRSNSTGGTGLNFKCWFRVS